MDEQSSKTALGLHENIAALLCYVLGWITGLIFLLVEKENSFVRFHAVQSLITFLILFFLSMFIGLIPVIGLIAQLLIGPLSMVLWVVLMYKAYRGEKYKLPWIGDWAEQQVERIKLL